MNELILFIWVMTIFLSAFLTTGLLVVSVLCLIEYRHNGDIIKAWEIACEKKL